MSLLQSYSPRGGPGGTRVSQTRDINRKGQKQLLHGANFTKSSEQQIADAFTKILGKPGETGDKGEASGPPLESERFKRRQRSPHNLGMYLDDEKQAPGRTLAENLFRQKKQRYKQTKMAHFSVDFSNI